MKNFLIVLGILAALGLIAWGTHYLFFSETAKKKKEIKRIFGLEANARTQADLAKMTLTELEAIK